jgi:hypothetical protein
MLKTFDGDAAKISALREVAARDDTYEDDDTVTGGSDRSEEC